MGQYHQLTQNERHLMAQLRQQGVAARTVALQLGRYHSTVYREVKRNATTHDGAFRDYKLIEWAYPVRGYFATPYHSWERGSNENVDRLIRQYLPKRQCLRNITLACCDWIADRLNHRPRKRYGLRTLRKL